MGGGHADRGQGTADSQQRTADSGHAAVHFYDSFILFIQFGRCSPLETGGEPRATEADRTRQNHA